MNFLVEILDIKSYYLLRKKKSDKVFKRKKVQSCFEIILFRYYKNNKIFRHFIKVSQTELIVKIYFFSAHQNNLVP